MTKAMSIDHYACNVRGRGGLQLKICFNKCLNRVKIYFGQKYRDLGAQ